MLRPHPLPDTPNPMDLGPRPHILVIKLATLGDMLLTTPALRALRQRYPEGRIDVLTTQQGAQLLSASPLVSRVLTLDKYAFDYPSQIVRQAKRAVSALQPLLELRAARYDAVLLMHHLTLGFGRAKYHTLLQVIGARHTVGLDNGRGRFLSVRVPDEGFGARHEADYALAVAAAADATLPSAERGLLLTDLGWTEHAAASAGQQPLIAMHPGSGGYSLARRWPAERFAALASALHREFGARIILVGGREEHALRQLIMEQLGSPDWMEAAASTTGVRDLARLLSRCALLIGNDSFPMHVAAALGVPAVAIFGPTNHRAWGPYLPDAADNAIIVRRGDLPCSPCVYRKHSLGTPQGCPSRPCLTELDVHPVLGAARRLLRKRAADAAPVG